MNNPFIMIYCTLLLSLHIDKVEPLQVIATYASTEQYEPDPQNQTIRRAFAVGNL